jgi:hypothetical protein
MSGTTETTKVAERSLPQLVMALLRYYLGRRRNQIILAAALLGIGAYFNWGWFVAAGIAPLLLAIAPCAVMCALGLCMRPSKSNATNSTPGDLSSVAQLRARLGYSTDSTESEAGDPNSAPRSIDPVSSVKADDRT